MTGSSWKCSGRVATVSGFRSTVQPVRAIRQKSDIQFSRPTLAVNACQSFPRKRESRRSTCGLPAVGGFWIPTFAGMTFKLPFALGYFNRSLFKQTPVKLEVRIGHPVQREFPPDFLAALRSHLLRLARVAREFEDRAGQSFRVARRDQKARSRRPRLVPRRRPRQSPRPALPPPSLRGSRWTCLPTGSAARRCPTRPGGLQRPFDIPGTGRATPGRVLLPCASRRSRSGP